MRKLKLDCRFLLIMIASLLGSAAAQERTEISERQRAEHLAQMKNLAGSIELSQGESRVKLVEEPVLRYSDNTRQNDEATLWIWSSGGRPSAILAVEYYPESPKGPRWLIEIASLSTERIAARRKPELRWFAKEPGLTLKALEDAAAPAEKAARRLSQMKDIRRRFTAIETEGTDGRIELRPLNSPLYRYSEPDAGILDGAIFAFANGTNPEVLLVLEAHARKDADPVWQYGLVQMTGAVVSVQLGGKEVWKRGEADPPAVRDSYVNGWISSAATEGER